MTRVILVSNAQVTVALFQRGLHVLLNVKFPTLLGATGVVEAGMFAKLVAMKL